MSITFAEFLEDFDFCLHAVSGITDPFGSWFDGHTLAFLNVFSFTPLNVELPFYVYISLPHTTKHRFLVFVHVPYLKRSAGKLLQKMLSGLGYPTVGEQVSVVSLYKLTRSTEAGTRFDEEMLRDGGFLDSSSSDQ